MPRPTPSGRLCVPVTFTALTALVALTPAQGEAQTRNPTRAGAASASLSYEMTADDGSYATLQRSAGERGLSAADFGAWLGENVLVSLEAGTDAPAEVRTTLVLLAVDAQGTVLSEGKVPLRSVPMKGDRLWLGHVGNARAMSNLLDEVFAGGGFAPWGAPAPAFPPDRGGDTFVTVVDGYRRMGARAGAQALRDRGFARGGVALVLLTLPEPASGLDRSLGVKMGGLVFLGMRPERDPSIG
jgi:hypothetical protein